MASNTTPPEPLLSLREAVVLLCALAAGTFMGVGTFLSGATPGSAALAALGTVGTATVGFHKLIGK